MALPAETVKNVRVAVDQVIAPRGGVLMAPLTAERPGDDWPRTIDLRLSDGRGIVGHVAWVHESGAARTERQWTEDPRRLAIRPIDPRDDTTGLMPAGGLGPYVLARLPMDGQGEIRLGRQKLHAVWRDVPVLASDVSNRRPLDRLWAPDRPDPDSPFEYWRWVLLAERLNMQPPTPAGNEIEQMAAEHFAGLWRIGMARLEANDAIAAGQCLQLLTATSIQPRQPFALWVTDPAQTHSLLSRLLDFRRLDAEIGGDAAAWVQEQAPFFFWPHTETGEDVGLIVGTSHNAPVTTTLAWKGRDEQPTIIEVEPGVLVHVEAPRPPLPEAPGRGLPAPAEPIREVLALRSGAYESELFFGPRQIIAKPPGVFFRPLAPPVTLAEVQSGIGRVVEPDRATHVQLRRLGGRWEVFFDCRRPAAPPSDDQVFDELTLFEQLRGVESVTVLLGSPDDDSDQSVWLMVAENSLPRVVRGQHDGTLQVHQRSYADRWYCRVVLPEAWFSRGETNPGLIGFIRGHGDSKQLETGPNACTPWECQVSRAAIDLTQWDDLPQALD